VSCYGIVAFITIRGGKYLVSQTAFYDRAGT
jgi:hypothetical protein